MNSTVEIVNEISEPVEEALRTIRSNIQFCSADKTIKTICLTSCIPNEGKSMTSINLAVSMADAEKKVLYIDADMRKPRFYKNVNLKLNVGLSNYLSGLADADEVISKTNIKNLDLVLCGPKPPNPAELIGGRRFGMLLERLKDRYDYIIIDTPPLGSMIDAAIVASKTDGTIILIEYKAIEVEKARKVKEQLEKANANIIGIVLNKVPKKEMKDYYQYNYYYRKNDSKEVNML